MLSQKNYYGYKEKYLKDYWIIIPFIVIILLSSCNSSNRNQDVVGWVERVRVYPSKLSFKAKLDTGAKHSSLHATNIKPFIKNGKQWVRFTLDNGKKTVTLEEPIFRVAQIKSRSEEKKVSDRYVIKLKICLGNISKTAEVNLTDRSQFIYPMLLGRSFLEGYFLIDSTKTLSIKPNCKQKK